MVNGATDWHSISILTDENNGWSIYVPVFIYFLGLWVDYAANILQQITIQVHMANRQRTTESVQFFI